MDDLDKLLERFRDLPVDPRLTAIDGAVMIGLSAHRERSTTLRSAALAGLVALTLGMAASLAPGVPAQAAAPFGAPPALAPSSLLAGE